MYSRRSKRGARGYLLKSGDEDELIAAIRTVNRGEALITPGLALNLIEEFRRLSQVLLPAHESNALTDGEMDVLRLIAQGKDNETVANQLHISANTVSNRLRSIYGKLHVHNRTQAALEALRRGWASLDEND